MNTKNNNNNVQPPAFIQQFSNTYYAAVAHAFIMHFNINDYAAPNTNFTIIPYLASALVSRDIIAIYARDKGIHFPWQTQTDGETMEQKTFRVLGLSQPQTQATSDYAIYAALQSTGVAPQPTESQLPRDPESAFPLLDKLLRITQDPIKVNKEGKPLPLTTSIIIESADLIIPDTPTTLMTPTDRTTLATILRWGRDPEITKNGNQVFIVTPGLSDIHQKIRTASSGYEAIEIPLPNVDHRLQYITNFISNPDNQVTLTDDLTPATIANTTAGLSLMNIEDILLRAKITGHLNRPMIWARKEQIIKTEFADVLEIIEPQLTFAHIGGLQRIKKYLHRAVITPMTQGNTTHVPMGILMTGPAGTGKTIMAEALAHEAGINAVRLRIGGQIASKWQGKGERNLERALRAINSLAPTIVFIDEIDQVVQRGGGDGSNAQNNRIFQRLLEYMSDTSHRGKVIFIAATNRPDKIDAALKRPGRFDKKIPFLVPEPEERKLIFSVMSQRYYGQPTEVTQATLDKTEGWTGAEIEATIIKSLEIAEDDPQLTWPDAIQQAANRLSPSTADIELMTRLAIKECDDPDLLPPRYQAQLAQRKRQIDTSPTQSRAELTNNRRRVI